MRQYETPPNELLIEIASELDAGREPTIFLFDSGRALLYKSRIVDIRAAQPGQTIGPPDLAGTPEYYQRGSYPVWFRLAEIAEANLDDQRWTYGVFPTRPDAPPPDKIGAPVGDADDLRATDATLWLMRRDVSE
jgi:hypothetical protein